MVRKGSWQPPSCRNGTGLSRARLGRQASSTLPAEVSLVLEPVVEPAENRFGQYDTPVRERMVGSVDHDLGDVLRRRFFKGFDQGFLMDAGWNDLVAAPGDEEKRLLGQASA